MCIGAFFFQKETCFCIMTETGEGGGETFVHIFSYIFRDIVHLFLIKNVFKIVRFCKYINCCDKQNCIEYEKEKSMQNSLFDRFWRPGIHLCQLLQIARILLTKRKQRI